MEEKILAIWLSEALGPGSVYGKKLIEKYGIFSEIYRLGQKDYEQCGIKADTVAMKNLLDKSLAAAEKSYAFCEYNYFGVIDITSNLYPKRLKSIKDPPPVLYVRGRMIDFDDNICVAVVGTRSYSDTGWNSTYKIAGGLAECGAIVVTGLASGIDTAATRAALESSGFAVGVLGSGLEKIYPSENRELFEEMYVKGLVISERVPFTGITGRYFPVRNRIISGLCNAVLVGEGEIKSGAMITAAHASEQGRRVFAIPADISNPESTGVNKLIREGATPVFDAWDILGDYEYLYPHRLSNVSDVSRISVPDGRSTKKVRVLKSNRALRTDDVPIRANVSEVAKQDRISVNKKTENNTATSAHVFEKVYEANTDNFKSADATSPFDMDSLSELDKKVYEYIVSADFRMTDAIASEIDEDPIEVAIAVTTLELAGLVEAEGPKVSKCR